MKRRFGSVDGMSWRELITGIYAGRKHKSGLASKPVFYPAASAEDIAKLEAQLRVLFPSSLRSVLLETNGMMEMLSIDGGAWFDNMWHLWTCERILERNQYVRREQSMGWHERTMNLTFFSDAGCDGIGFAFPVMEGRVCASNVVAWYPIDDEVKGAAPSLAEFLKGWLTGALAV